MKTVSDCLKVLVNNVAIDDAPINILIDGRLHDIKDFYYDSDISEYVMELTEGYEYDGTNKIMKEYEGD